MSRQINRYGFIVMASLGLSGYLGDSVAAPSVWWDHLENRSGETVSNCVTRASTILLPEKMHHVTVDADSVRSWSDRTVGIVECIPLGDTLLTAILVTGEDAEEGGALFKKIREGMR